MLVSLRSLRIYLLLTAIILVGLFSFFPEVLSNSTASAENGSSEYKPLGNVRAGIWNDGQAAFWDLNIIDHFRIFGPPERLRGFSPQQPIAFSHITHVQKNKIECQFCHWNAAKSGYVSIPEVQTCAGCHKAISVPGQDPIAAGVVGTTPEQKAEIKKIHKAFVNNEPIPWVKVHVMPDYVKFNHKRHVKAGVACQQCHGQIPEMEKVERVSSMKMGWCVSCHREQGASIDCYTCHR